MSLKKNFARKALNYNKRIENAWEASPGPLVLTVAAGAGLFFGSGLSIDELKDLETTAAPGQEIAVQQHETALTTLESMQQEVANFHGSAHFATDALSNIIDLPDDGDNAASNIRNFENNYDDLLEAFVTSVHIDPRLSEVDAQKLLTAFETQHGAIEDVTSFEHGLDYDDLSEARAATSGQGSSSEYSTAKDINQYSAETHHVWERIGVGVGGALLPYLLMMMIGMNGARLRRWEHEKPKPKNTGRFNH